MMSGEQAPRSGGKQATEKDKAQPLDGYVDIKEAAERLDVSTKTIRRYIQAERLHAEKIRNVWLIAAEEIERLLHEDEIEAQAAAAALPRELTARLEAVEQKLDALTLRLGDAQASPGIEKKLDEILARLEAPAQAAPGIDQKLDAIRARFDQLPLLTDSVEKKLGELAARLDEAPLPAGDDLQDAQSRASMLEEENQALRYEIESLNREAAKARSESSIDPQAIKSRAEEIDALKATVISNERGLALLREEVAHKDSVIKEKEQEIFLLLEKLKEMESTRKPVQAPSSKSRFFGGFTKS